MEPGPAGSSCPLFVTLGKLPKGLQNHRNSIRFIDKSEEAKSLFELGIFSIAEGMRNHWFAQGFGVENAENSFHLSRKNKCQMDGVLLLSTF